MEVKIPLVKNQNKEPDNPPTILPQEKEWVVDLMVVSVHREIPIR
jgi:hypothetical protein